jgi:dihydropteroate synthase
MRQNFSWVLPRTRIQLGPRTAIMGILNVTPDSFSDGGKYFDKEKAVNRAKEMEREGADIIDVGGESSRPGSSPVSLDEEIRRVLPVIEALAQAINIPISVDTYRSGVARRALEVGAQIVNDISGLRFDDELGPAVKKAGAAVVLMHSRGSREELHTQTPMSDPMQEIFNGMSESIQRARDAGIAESSIVVDPGIGFGKTASESVLALKTLNVFSKLQYPLLVGTSRKSFIRSIIHDNSEARVWGTAATVAISIMNGAHIVRVHDVGPMRIVADVTDGILKL